MNSFLNDSPSQLKLNPALEGHEWVYFQESQIHRLGGFAKKRIRKGTRIIEYLGEKIPKHVSAVRLEANNPYIFVLSDEWDLDGNVDWNPAKYFNHSCSPNCESDVVDGRVWIVATRLIQPDEELTYNYGFDLEEYSDYPCACGSPECVGYIVAAEFVDEVKKRATAQGADQTARAEKAV